MPSTLPTRPLERSGRDVAAGGGGRHVAACGGGRYVAAAGGGRSRRGS
jgi:hypothetical protein